MGKKPVKALHPVTQYAEDIKSGKILANKWMRLACMRHLKDNPEKHDSIDKCNKRGFWFDKAAATHIIAFFPEFLIFYEGDFNGQPFVLTPHQQFIVGSIFGWKKGNLRRFHTAYIEEGKGNGKTPLAAGIGLYGLVFDDEPGCEIYSAAVTYNQAGVLFRDARLYAEASESLKEILTVDKYNIAYDAENSFFRPVSSEHRGLDGKKPHMALIDEIHEHLTDLVVRKMSAGTKTRRQPLIFEITNAGYDRKSICYQHHEYTAKILEGIIEDDSWFGIMTGLDVCPKCESEGKTIPQDGCPDCDNWRDEKVWVKANPNLKYLGIPFYDYLKRQVKEGMEMSSQENIVKRLNFCIWTDAATMWMPSEKWKACCDPSLNIDDFTGQPCYLGVDLANKKDFCAIIMAFEYEKGLAVFAKFYLPEETISESKNQNYKTWIKQGHIIQTPGARTDFKHIEEDLKAINSVYPIMELAFDPAYSTYLINNIMEWLGNEKCIEINQGPAHINEPMQEVEARVYSKTLWHNGDPVLAWMMSNVEKKEGSGGTPVKYYYPTRSTYENKIDGAVALIMAVGRVMSHKDGFAYSGRSLIVG